MYIIPDIQLNPKSNPTKMKNLLKTGLLGLLCVFALAANAQVPKFNSYPSASAVIFLDFDGHSVTGTSWNYNGPIFAQPSTLTNDQITTIYNSVAEDYQPFNINVTTDSTKYWSAPATKRMRVILTVTSSWYGSAGGVAYSGSFTWGDNTPCWVFTGLLNNNVKFISEAAAHEAGHTLGLRHQSAYDAACVKTSEYNYGNGSGEIGWAPIMGVGYYKNFTTWHNGPNPYGCNSSQQDLDIISGTTNGFGFRPDDFGDDTKSAAPLAVEGTLFKSTGMISAPTDMDVFSFTVATIKQMRFDIIPASVSANNSGSNLDVEVQLFKKNNNQVTQIGVYNPPTVLSASIDTLLNAGTYYLLVKSTGNEFSSGYGSLGEYSIMEQAPPVTLPLRTLKLNGSADNRFHKFNWIIDADEKVVSQVLEISTDGQHFQEAATPSTTDRLFNYIPSLTGVLQYRLKVVFDNDHLYYSNIISLRTANNNSRPELMGNIVTNSQLSVNSPGNYAYIIYNLNGKMIAKGTITAGVNKVQAPNLVNGFYMIRFNNGYEEWNEKFVSH